MEKLIDYYKRMGAPQDQNALISLLKEVQQIHNGIPSYVVSQIAQEMDVKESLLLALIRRIPSLRLADTHILEMCAGPNCGKHTALSAFAEKNMPKNVQIKYVPCMRLCAKGPNVKFDGKLYHGADEALLRTFIQEVK
jgi:NADH:ubiquinone oxidoreductase subunit E